MKKRVLHILFWSVIAAAFIGPGTLTTAALAGAGFRYSLIWTLVFATFTCYVLQEASARLAIVTRNNLGQALRIWLSESFIGQALLYFTMVAVVFGCVAYESGNIVGAVAGIGLLFAWDDSLMVFVVFLLSTLVLSIGKTKQIAVVLGILVAIMGTCFLVTVFFIPINWTAVFLEGWVPQVPLGSEVLVIGLIGTTVVPYNLFLGSGLKHVQSLAEMRWNLGIAIGIGGLISIAVLLVGTVVQSPFSFQTLAQALESRWGWSGKLLLGTGLFCAGFSSAITAALAAAFTVKSILEREDEWGEGTLRFRSIWFLVLLSGTVMALLGWKPIPLIVLGQAFNGIVLPILAIFIWLIFQQTQFLKRGLSPSAGYIRTLGLVVFVCTVIGLNSFLSLLPFYPDWGFLIVIPFSLLLLYLIQKHIGKK